MEGGNQAVFLMVDGNWSPRLGLDEAVLTGWGWASSQALSDLMGKRIRIFSDDGARADSNASGKARTVGGDDVIRTRAMPACIN